MEKIKEQLLKETVNRFKELVNYNFQPKGYGFVETPANREEIKEKMVIKEEEQPKSEQIIKKEIVKEVKNDLKEEVINLAKKYGSKNPELIYESVKKKLNEEKPLKSKEIVKK